MYTDDSGGMRVVPSISCSRHHYGDSARMGNVARLAGAFDIVVFIHAERGSGLLQSRAFLITCSYVQEI